MRRAAFAWSLLFAVNLAAAPPLFNGSTESRWIVTRQGSSIGTVTLLTSGSGTRAEFRPVSGPVAMFLGGQGKVWTRAAGGDVEWSASGATTPAAIVAPALLLPFTAASGNAVPGKDGNVASYSYGNAKATYTFDGKGASKVEVTSGSARYTLTRSSLSKGTAAASTFEVRPKKGTASRLARLSGDLLGPSDTTVSATAGSRGVGTVGLKLSDGGNYDEVKKLEQRDAAWRPNLDTALDEFQKDGKVGKARENQ